MISFHHKPGPQNPTKKGIPPLKKEDLEKRGTKYGSYEFDLPEEKQPKLHKKDKERPRC